MGEGNGQDASCVDKALEILEACGQNALVATIKERENVQDRIDIANQILRLNEVTPTGMKLYVERARRLLLESKNGVNAFADYKPEVPDGVFMKAGQPEFDEYESAGLKELEKVGFVLIAGGLGERLGYSNIKIGLPVSTIKENYSYL